MSQNEWLNYAPQPRQLQNGQGWNVFLSYRSVNRTWVLNLYDILIEAKFSVFMDQYELNSGEKLLSRLNAGLGKSQAGILIWSKAASDSVWVEGEYELLETRATADPSFFFVPICLDNTALPPFSRTRVYNDFSSYPDGPNGGELLRLLFGITGERMGEAAVRFANQQDELSKQAAVEIKAALINEDPEEIVRLAAQDTLPWRSVPSLSCAAAESLIKLGKNDAALTILSQCQERFPKAIRPKQLQALALARSGARNKDVETIKKAQGILSKLYAEGEGDPETLGIYGRTWMDRYDLLTVEPKDDSFLRRSRNYYAEAFERAPDDYYVGINAAAKSVLLGTPEDLEKGKGYAARTLTIVGTRPWPKDYWKTATVAELLLIEQKYAAAGEMYAAAVDMEPGSVGNHGSSRGQAEKLLAKLGASEEEKKEVLRAFPKK